MRSSMGKMNRIRIMQEWDLNEFLRTKRDYMRKLFIWKKSWTKSKRQTGFYHLNSHAKKANTSNSHISIKKWTVSAQRKTRKNLKAVISISFSNLNVSNRRWGSNTKSQKKDWRSLNVQRSTQCSKSSKLRWKS